MERLDRLAVATRRPEYNSPTPEQYWTIGTGKGLQEFQDPIGAVIANPPVVQPAPQVVATPQGNQYVLPNFSAIPQTTFNTNGPCPGGDCTYYQQNNQTGSSQAQADAAAKAFYGGGAISPLLRAAFNRSDTRDNAAQFNANLSGAQVRQQQLGNDPAYWTRVADLASRGVSLPEASRIAAMDSLPSQDVGVLGPQLMPAVDAAGRAGAAISERTGVMPEFMSPSVPTMSRNPNGMQLDYGTRQFNIPIAPGMSGQEAARSFMGVGTDPRTAAREASTMRQLAIKQQYALALQSAKTEADIKKIQLRAENDADISFEEKQAIKLAAAQRLKASPGPKQVDERSASEAVDAAAR